MWDRIRAPRASGRSESLRRYTESVPRSFDRGVRAASCLRNYGELRATTCLSLSRFSESLPRNAERLANIDLSLPRFDDGRSRWLERGRSMCRQTPLPRQLRLSLPR